ncbi:Crossover junction endodeoxyribonuclease [Desulfonema limicola]|uniref:Crossover junction endodeoxyribonuclease n=1 Tax=Desulfonema limicola TaxID=45656 RepID=A0A975GGQ5_9BACT|nr:crossover junction endodeoxyribonuclease RuvC [Desulfonema limicola]QTA80504.1 Crossover junction endodeoxyribonuclease [Desulfonema limicola]
MQKIIGIDPGLASTGVGLVWGNGLKVKGYSYGSIHTLKQNPVQERLGHIFSKLLMVLKNEKPDLMIVEEAFSLDKYPKSGITLGKVIGVILLAGFQADLIVKEVPVREAKQILTGNGNADKVQLEKSVRHTLKMTNPIRPFHASDALALALIGLYRFQSL